MGCIFSGRRWFVVLLCLSAPCIPAQGSCEHLGAPLGVNTLGHVGPCAWAEQAAAALRSRCAQLMTPTLYFKPLATLRGSFSFPERAALDGSILAPRLSICACAGGR